MLTTDQHGNGVGAAESKKSKGGKLSHCLAQNRRQKVFNRGALRSCGRAWHSKKWQKLNWHIVFHVSIWGGLSSQKPSRSDRTDLAVHIFFLPMDSQVLAVLHYVLWPQSLCFLWSGHSFRTYVQSKWLTEPKSMLLPWPGPHTERHVNDGCTFNGLLWS